MIEYNFKVLSKLLSSLSLLIKANVSIFDENGTSSDARNLNIFPFCMFIKDDVRKKCAISDKLAIEKIAKQDEPFYYYCHFGLVEIILKFSVDAKSSFYILIGPFRDPKKYKENIEHIKEYCHLFKKDEKSLIKKYKAIPSFSINKYQSIIDMITIILNYAKTTKLIASKDNFLEKELDPYINKHLNESIRVENICNELFLSHKQLERVVKLYSGTTPKKYILKYKVDRAYNDIRYSENALVEIAERYGFIDYNYFVRVFKKIKGVLPSEVRKEAEEDN